MPMPMIGPWRVRVNAARPFEIHGDQYLELHVTDLADSSNHRVRVPRHALTVNVAVGTDVTLTVLMGQITGVSGPGVS